MVKRSYKGNLLLPDLNGIIVGSVMIEDFETNEYITENPMFLGDALEYYPELNKASVLNIGVYRDSIVWIEVEF